MLPDHLQFHIGSGHAAILISLAENAVIDLFPVNRHFPRCGHANPDLVPLDAQNGDFHIIVDDQGFPDPSR